MLKHFTGLSSSTLDLPNSVLSYASSKLRKNSLSSRDLAIHVSFNAIFTYLAFAVRKIP